MWPVLLLFVGVIIGVMFLPMRSLSHMPKQSPKETRAAAAARKNAESCVWLQRLLAACMDALATTDLISRGCRKVEARLAATLEDRGYCRNVLLRLTNVGRSPPIITTISVSASSSNPCSIEAEVDLEYDGGAELTFHGICSLPFRRSLAVEARLSKLSFACRARVTAEIRQEGIAECVVNVMLDSEPRFHCDLDTTVGGPLKLKNSWIVVFLVRWGLLFGLRRRMIEKQGVTFTFPVGQEWNDMMLWDGERGRIPPSGTTSENNWSPQPTLARASLPR